MVDNYLPFKTYASQTQPIVLLIWKATWLSKQIARLSFSAWRNYPWACPHEWWDTRLLGWSVLSVLVNY